MKLMAYSFIVICAGAVAGCAASVPPAELIDARQAFSQASAGQAAQLVPAELHKAEMALAAAEKSFKDDPKSFRTRDLAYVADRKAKMAEALAVTAAGNAVTVSANKDLQATQAEIMKNTKADLAASQRSDTLKAGQLAAEQTARLDAEKRAGDAQAALTSLAAVKDEARGLVITLSGSVLFASNKSALLPAAQNRLNQVAEALMENKDRKLTVEGYTDSRGSAGSNLTLSQQRADMVRTYIISRGYPGDLIIAQGMGQEKPVADNASAEGRANNRRVEIVVAHAAR